MNTKEYLQKHSSLGEAIELALGEAKELFAAGAGISKVVTDLQDAEAIIKQRCGEIRAQLEQEKPAGEPAKGSEKPPAQ